MEPLLGLTSRLDRGGEALPTISDSLEENEVSVTIGGAVGSRGLIMIQLVDNTEKWQNVGVGTCLVRTGSESMGDSGSAQIIRSSSIVYLVAAPGAGEWIRLPYLSGASFRWAAYFGYRRFLFSVHQYHWCKRHPLSSLPHQY